MGGFSLQGVHPLPRLDTHDDNIVLTNTTVNTTNIIFLTISTNIRFTPGTKA